jgi:hypothetical protein
MAYYIFNKNSANIDNTIYKVAENISDYNDLNIFEDSYKVIINDQINFEDIKLGNKIIKGYDNNNNISFVVDTEQNLYSKYTLKEDILNTKEIIKNYLENNLSSSSYSKWKNYYNQLDSLLKNIDTEVTFPLRKSIPQYFKDKSLPYFSPLQIP